MTAPPLMRGAPPAPQHQVTLANWRLPPFSRWAFQHVGELVPSALIAAGAAGPATPEPAFRVLGATGFEGHDGAEWRLDRFLPAARADGLVVLQQGRLVHEWYDAGCDPRRRHIVFSVSKSLTGAFAGLAVDDGALDPDAPVTRYVPEAEGSAYGDCTVRHVLDMTVSVAFDESYLDPDGAFQRYRQAMGWNPAPPGAPPADLRRFLLTLGKGDGPHGEVFDYVSPNSDMLGWILERATGRRFADLFAERVWQPMGASQDAFVTVDAMGAPRTAGGICTTVRDLARFGELMRRRGAIAGRQVVPGWWVDDILAGGDRDAWARGAFHAMFPAGAYRSQWYVANDARGAFCAIGIHGQWIYVDQAADLVIALVSSQAEPTDDALDAALLRAFSAVAAALG